MSPDGTLKAPSAVTTFGRAEPEEDGSVGPAFITVIRCPTVFGSRRETTLRLFIGKEM